MSWGRVKTEPHSSWKVDFIESIKKCTLKGNYKAGLNIAKAGLKKYPKEFICRYQYAKLLGDWADELPTVKQKKLKHEASRILRPLTKSLARKDFDTRFGLCLNYYYQSYRFRAMYRFGKRIAISNKRGYYAQGLGACLYAEHLYKNNASLRQWPQKSIQAWKKYDLKKEKYYFPHYVYAKALALNGDAEAALKHLKNAARLSKRSIKDWEFADVLEILQNS